MSEFIVGCKYCHGKGHVKLDTPDEVGCDFCASTGRLPRPWWDKAEQMQDDAKVMRCDCCGHDDAVTVELWGHWSICARCALEKFRNALARALDIVLAEEREAREAREQEQAA